MPSEWKVRLSCDGNPSGEIVFEASAAVAENRSSAWDGYNITHLPTSLLSYKNTSARKFGIQAKLVSRTPEEARTNAHYLDLIRSWILPDFGGTGAVPPILRLSAYGNKNIQNLSVIVDQYSWGFPEDVDYIFDGTNPMPVIGVINIELQEIWSALEITNQDWRMVLDDPGNGFGAAESELGAIINTPSPGALGSGMFGIMTAAGQAANAGAAGVRALGALGSGLAGVFGNAGGAAGAGGGGSGGATNSPQISASTTSAAPNSPFVTNILPGELSGVPQAPFQSARPAVNDGFNRGVFTISRLISG